MNRYYTNLINELLTFFPCVALVGVRQCGKTTLLKQLPSCWKYIDLEKGSDFDIVAHDPDLFFRLNSKNIAIDEAQLLPPVFSALRVAIDNDRSAVGRFIITGSSSYELIHSISESLAGRVAIVEIAPFSMGECFEQPISNLYSIINEKKDIAEFLKLTPQQTVEEVHQYWLKGGYPEPVIKDNLRFTKLWMENYNQTYINRDVLKLFPKLDLLKYRQFIKLLSNISGTIINYSNMAQVLSVSQPTAREYLNIAHGTFIWRTIPAFDQNAKKRIVKHPKGYLRDTGLLHHLLRIYQLDDLLAHPCLGASWEAMVIENILKNFNALGIHCDYYHYRTSGGAEVDLVLEGDFGLLPIEIKYGQKVKQKNLRGINDFIKEYQCNYGIVINNDEVPRLYNDKLIGIPAIFF